MLVLGNIFSFCTAVVFILTAYERDRKKLCIAMVITQIFNILTYLCVGRYTGIGTSLLNLVRAILVSKKNYGKGFAAFYVTLQLVLNTNFVRSVIDILPVIGGCVNAVAYVYLSEDKELPFRAMSSVSSIFLWLPYYILSGLVSAALMEIYLIIAKLKIIRSIFKERKFAASKDMQMN